jgi:hypothetical protein
MLLLVQKGEFSMKKWQIAVTIVIVILAVAIFFFAHSTNIYSARVVTVEAGGSIGMAPFTDRIDFGDVPQGTSVTKTVSLKNNGNSSNTIKVYVLGSISQLIDVVPGKSFELAAGKSQDIDFKLSMPASAPVGKKFTGRIIILKLP